MDNHLAQVRVAGLSPVARSEKKRRSGPFLEGPDSRLGKGKIELGRG